MSKLEDISVSFRKREITRNTYDQNNEFNGSHPNALSDGDEKGKGDKGGSVGSATDIKMRKDAEARNKFNKNREYNDSTA